MFKVYKKNGNERTIYSPSSNLGILQKKLAYILSLNFSNHDGSHGFVKNRSIVTNAFEHLNKKFVLNLDLENFFESISFSRVRHMFMAYFKFNDKVATTLSNICCHPTGFLPQGAPTSPIVSNILAKTLDKELKSVAVGTRWSQYTRYADDITFSTNKKIFPKEIAYFNEEGNLTLSENIVKIIENNGFKINDQKTRLQNYKQSQSVTGITVNEKLNIDRKYIRRIRSILNCIEKNIDNLDVAKKIFESKYSYRQSKKGKKPDMFLILRGMISHVGHVKGKQDSVFWKLATRFNDITPYSPIKLPLSKREFHENHTFIISHDNPEIYFTADGDSNEVVYGQGTGFLLKNVGLVTNAHVISDVIEEVLEKKGSFLKEYYIEIFKSTDYYEKQWAKVVSYDIERDIAILSVKGIDISKTGYRYIESIKEGDSIEIIGHPNYRKGQDIKIQNGVVQGTRKHEHSINKRISYDRFEINTTIFVGNSGGPIVNKSNEVMAIAVKGAGIIPNEVIPISEVIRLAKKDEILEKQIQ